MLLTRSLPALLLTFCGSLAAEPVADEEELAQVYGHMASFTLATGNATSVRRAPAVAAVITARDIAAMGATDLDQVLETVAGLHVNRTANLYSPLYVVRGIVSQFTPQVLVLQNGAPITTLYQSNKGNLWAGYPVDHIARIEVLRGPGSALYGSDAYSGVINIVTKNAGDVRGTDIGLRAGSFGNREAWLQHGGKLGEADLAIYLRAATTDGFRSIIRADAQTRNDTLFGTHASLAPGPVNLGSEAIDGNLELTQGPWRLRAGLKLRDKIGTGAGVASALDPVGLSKSVRSTGELSWNDQLGRDWSGGASLTGLYYAQITPVDFQLLPPGLRFPSGLFPNGMHGGPDTRERHLRLSGHLAYTGWQGHQLRIGVGHDDLNLYRTFETRNFSYAPSGLPVPQPGVIDYSQLNPFLRPHRRRIDYLYVQDEWQLGPDWALTAGLRHDRYSDFGGTTNPRLALVWDASLDLTAKLMYGRAFRAPAFIEAYGESNPVALGNPNLRPETNGTLEAALAWQARSDTQLNLTIYRYRMGDMIRTVPNAIAGTGATYRNTGDQDGHGLELEAVFQAARTLRMLANYSWQRSTDKASGRDAGYAPRHHLYARAEWQPANGIVLAPQLNLVAGRARAPGDARRPIADYATVDLALRRERGHGAWEWSASLRNLFNADVREPSQAPGLQLPFDLPMAPRSLVLQVSRRM